MIIGLKLLKNLNWRKGQTAKRDLVQHLLPPGKWLVLSTLHGKEHASHWGKVFLCLLCASQAANYCLKADEEEAAVL